MVSKKSYFINKPNTTSNKCLRTHTLFSLHNLFLINNMFLTFSFLLYIAAFACPQAIWQGYASLGWHQKRGHLWWRAHRLWHLHEPGTCQCDSHIILAISNRRSPHFPQVSCCVCSRQQYQNSAIWLWSALTSQRVSQITPSRSSWA